MLIDIMKIKHLIHYFVIQKITSKDQFNENMDDLLLFSRENTYEDGFDCLDDWSTLINEVESDAYAGSICPWIWASTRYFVWKLIMT